MFLGLGIPITKQGLGGPSTPVPPDIPLTGLVGWWKADSGTLTNGSIPTTTDGDPVYQWLDYSGNGAYLIQATGTSQPTLKLNIQNSLPVLRFDGVDDWIQRSMTRTQPCTTFVVARKSAAGNRYILAGGNDLVAGSQNETSHMIFGGALLTGTSTPANWNVVSGLFNTANSKIFINGVLANTGNILTNSATTTNVGSLGGTSNFWQGDVGEVLHYNGALSDVDRQTVENYLGTRWNITMGAPPFTPTSIAGLQAWYKADGTRWQDSARTTPAVADADPVGALDDYSGNARHLLQATSTKRPTLKLAMINGLPVLRGDGVDDILRSSVFTLDPPYTVAFVARALGVAGGKYYLDGAVQNHGVCGYAGATSVLMYNGASFNITVTTQANAFTAVAVFNGASSILRYNGAETVGNPGISTGGNGVTLFGSGNPDAQYQNCDIGEVLAYNSALSLADRTAVADYLKAKWATP